MAHLSDVIVWVVVAAAAAYAARSLLPARIGQALHLRTKGDDGGCHEGATPPAQQDRGAACGGGCSGCASGQPPKARPKG